MRPAGHRTPRYLVDRVARALHQRLDPTAPWLNRAMVRFLAERIEPAHVVAECGAGRSTAWFARRAARVLSVEHDPTWAARVSADLERLGLVGRVDLHVTPRDATRGTPEAYVERLHGQAEASLDLVLVDGKLRDRCALAALACVRPGGWIVVDDVHRYLPRDAPSRAPHARSRADGPASEEWARFAAAVAGWECHWTSDGVSDAAAWRRPAGELA